jgi:lambda repressor-like predicted transcriptional regulator
MNDANPRAALANAIRARGESFASISRHIGRNAAYIQQYVQRGVPSRLEERDLRAIARHLGVAAAAIGAEGADPLVSMAGQGAPGDYLVVPPLDASAHVAAMAFHGGFLESLCAGPVERLRAWTVAGDAMAPTLNPGDQLVVDPEDGLRRLRDGLYLLGGTQDPVVKRLAVHPERRILTILSDNPAYPTWPDCSPDALGILGRVIWAGRRL